MNKFQRVPDNDPNRCQAVHANYQCPFRAIGDYDPEKRQWTGSKYCPRHGGNNQTANDKLEEKRIYLAALWKNQIGEQADHPKIKSLREEIGIARMTLNKLLESIKDDSELLMRSGTIMSMIAAISKAVEKCDLIERNSNLALDQSQALAFIKAIVTIINNYISEPEILDLIIEDMKEQLAVLTKGN